MEHLTFWWLDSLTFLSIPRIVSHSVNIFHVLAVVFSFSYLINFIFAAENAIEEEYSEKEQEKPLLEDHVKGNLPTVTTINEKRSNYQKKNADDSKSRSAEGSANRNVEGIELASEVCPFGLAKNLEKQICIIPSRKKSKCPKSRLIKTQTVFLFVIFFYESIRIHSMLTCFLLQSNKNHFDCEKGGKSVEHIVSRR